MERLRRSVAGAALCAVLFVAPAPGEPAASMNEAQLASGESRGLRELVAGNWAEDPAGCGGGNVLRLHADGTMEANGLRGVWELTGHRIILFARAVLGAEAQEAYRHTRSYNTEWQVEEVTPDRLVLNVAGGTSRLVRCA